MKNQSGQAVILSVFVIGMISILIGMSQIKLGVLESFRGRSSAGALQAYYSANSGIEHAIKLLEEDKHDPFKLSVGGGIDNVNVTFPVDNDNTKVIESVAKNGKYIRRIKVTVQKSFGYNYAVQAGNGGIDIDNNSHVDINPVFLGTPADVWSNSYINGANKKPGTSSSDVNGSAYAVDQIGCLGSTKNCGVYVHNDAWSGHLNACTVNGIKYSENTPDKDCNGTTNWNNTNSDIPIGEVTMPLLGVTKPVNTVPSCTMTGSNQDCGSGNYKLGNITVDGDLIIDTPSDVTVEIIGSLWVTGNLIIKSNVVIGLTSDTSSPAYTESQRVAVEGIIESNSNVTFKSNEKDGKAAFLLFASTKATPSEIDDVCDVNDLSKGEINNAISLSSNTNSVLFYALNGCVLVNQNAKFYGAVLGKKVKLDANSYVYYDPRLSGGSEGKTWKITGFEEM